MRHKLSRRVGWKAGAGACALALALVAGGCAPDYVTGSTAPVNLLIASINDGGVLDSDVRLSSGTICPDTVHGLARRPREEPEHRRPSPSRSTSWSSSTRCGTSGRTAGRTRASTCRTASRARSRPRSTSPSTGTTSVPVQVVRRQSKLEPPLSNITGIPDRQHDRRDHDLGPDSGRRGGDGDRKDAGRLRGLRRRQPPPARPSRQETRPCALPKKLTVCRWRRSPPSG